MTTVRVVADSADWEQLSGDVFDNGSGPTRLGPRNSGPTGSGQAGTRNQASGLGKFGPGKSGLGLLGPGEVNQSVLGQVESGGSGAAFGTQAENRLKGSNQTVTNQSRAGHRIRSDHAELDPDIVLSSDFSSLPGLSYVRLNPVRSMLSSPTIGPSGFDPGSCDISGASGQVAWGSVRFSPERLSPLASNQFDYASRSNHDQQPLDAAFLPSTPSSLPLQQQQQPPSSQAPPGGVPSVETGASQEALHELQRVTVVLLGARGVGKTSLARQFVRSDYTEEYRPTRSRGLYHASVVVNERVYEVKLVDCSSVVRFPVSSLHEWNEHRGCCLRNASAYLLVYDVTDDDSFRYVRSMREQIVRCRDVRDVPIFIAANKQDLVMLNSGLHAGASAHASSINRAAKSREAQANAVRKQWKCGFVECSSKYNWRVTAVFRELLRAVDHAHHGHRAASHRVQEALRIERCVIL